ncbi:MAG: NADH-quinone oxidoreductase subunit C, partial [bacterium]
MAEQVPETVEAVAENPLKLLGAAIAAAAPQGAVTGFDLVRGGAELAVHANRNHLLALMLLLRDDPRFSFEQCMDICGVDWPERAER